MRFGFGARDEIEMHHSVRRALNPAWRMTRRSSSRLLRASGVSLPCFTISASLSIWANLPK